jgi:hypothetical protein
MIDREFVSFAEAHLQCLDEITRAYREFQQQTCQEYWRGLQNLSRRELPAGGRFSCDPEIWKPGEAPRCGWVYRWDVHEIFVGFSVHLNVDRLIEGSWPFSGRWGAWTGICFESRPDAGLLDYLHRSALTTFADVEKGPWWVYHDFTSLTQAGPERIYQEITSLREESCRKVLADLKLWMEFLSATPPRKSRTRQGRPRAHPGGE